jgi:hypothetical protein
MTNLDSCKELNVERGVVSLLTVKPRYNNGFDGGVTVLVKVDAP